MRFFTNSRDISKSIINRIAVGISTLMLIVFYSNAYAQTVTFSYTGAMQTWTVPVGTTSIQVDASGAGGGTNINGQTLGGVGARVRAILTVIPGQILQVRVGERGAVYSSYNGGGSSGGGSFDPGSGGGGATDLRSVSNGGTLVDRLLVAGGGGGGSILGYQGGVGGIPNGGDGGGVIAGNLGTGATQSAGGYGGGGAGDGTAGQGGSSTVDSGAGAGGGGYYGGGAGGTGARGGGGGSSWVIPTGSESIIYSLATGLAPGALSITIVKPLPVELTAFTAQMQGPSTVALSWSTASEKNSDRFEMERSTDGLAFMYVRTVVAAGTSSTPRTYFMTDASLPTNATTLYFRLRQVDTDGTVTFSPVRAVTRHLEASKQLLAYPNPAHDILQLQGLALIAPLEVFNALGRQVWSQPIPAVGAKTSLSLAELPKGIYILRCGALTQRLILE